MSHLVKSLSVCLALSLISTATIAEEATDKVETIVVSEAINAEILKLTADCTMPQSPTMPDGFLASKDEMLSARKAIAAFQEKLQAYRSCIDQVRLNFPPEVEQKDQKLQAIKNLYNTSVDTESVTAEQFNKSVRAFNERNVSSK